MLECLKIVHEIKKIIGCEIGLSVVLLVLPSFSAVVLLYKFKWSEKMPVCSELLQNWL